MFAMTFGIGNWSVRVYCVHIDSLNTEGGRGSVSWLIRVRTRKDYALKLCLDLAYS